MGKEKEAANQRVRAKAERRYAADQAVLDQLAQEANAAREKTNRLRAIRMALQTQKP